MTLLLPQFRTMVTALANAGEQHLQTLLQQIEDNTRDDEARGRDLRDSSELITAIHYANTWINRNTQDEVNVVDIPLEVLDPESRPLGDGTVPTIVEVLYSYANPGVELSIGSLVVRIESTTPTTVAVNVWENRSSNEDPNYRQEFDVDSLFHFEDDEGLSAVELSKRYGPWASYPRYLIEEWRQAVIQNQTRLGYWEWVAEKLKERIAQDLNAENHESHNDHHHHH